MEQGIDEGTIGLGSCLLWQVGKVVGAVKVESEVQRWATLERPLLFSGEYAVDM